MKDIFVSCRRTFAGCIISILSILMVQQIHAENLLVNPGLEDSDYSFSPWNEVSFKPGPIVTIQTKGAHSGKNCASIENPVENDTRLVQTVPVDEQSSYKISGWIRTEDVGSDGGGAIISLNDFFYASDPLHGTNIKWQYEEFFVTIKYEVDHLSVAMRLGNYGGECTGKAFFDDISVTKVSSIPGGKLTYTLGNSQKPEEQASNSFAGTAGTGGNAGKPVEIRTLLTIVFMLLSAGVFSVLFIVKKRPSDK
jgi:hypothetical protein